MSETLVAPASPVDLDALEALHPGLIGDLRSDHAGETGAVMIYRGILALARDPAVRRFAAAHLATERRHLDMIEAWLPAEARSLLLPIWRLAGFLVGALPALTGAGAVYATIDAVETFVDAHYTEQIDRLSGDGPDTALRDILLQCRADEIHHRDEARAQRSSAGGPLLSAWCRLVDSGSRWAVAAARRM